MKKIKRISNPHPKKVGFFIWHIHNLFLYLSKQLKTYTMTRKIYEKVEEYVRKKYFLMFKKEDTLIIDEYESHFTVKKHETSSPLILGKEILD
jgi:hypothetical protein